MNKICLLITVLSLTISSCKKESISFKTEYNTSYIAWTSFKVSSGNSYSYITYYGSVFGSYAETKITVTNGIVTGRDYKAGTYAPNSSTLQVNTTWSETGAQLNSHQQGAATLTLDDIYARAKKEWLTADKSKNEVYFEAENNGIISSCGYVPKGCQDDCFTGVNIKSVARL